MNTNDRFFVKLEYPKENLDKEAQQNVDSFVRQKFGNRFADNQVIPLSGIEIFKIYKIAKELTNLSKEYHNLYFNIFYWEEQSASSEYGVLHVEDNSFKDLDKSNSTKPPPPKEFNGNQQRPIDVSGGLEHYYQALGTKPTDSWDTIRSAYKRLAFQNHPDRNPNNPAAEKHFLVIQKAFDGLKNHYKNIMTEIVFLKIFNIIKENKTNNFNIKEIVSSLVQELKKLSEIQWKKLSVGIKHETNIFVLGEGVNKDNLFIFLLSFKIEEFGLSAAGKIMLNTGEVKDINITFENKDKKSTSSVVAKILNELITSLSIE